MAVFRDCNGRQDLDTFFDMFAGVVSTPANIPAEVSPDFAASTPTQPPILP
jgi:hypothetical protein